MEIEVKEKNGDALVFILRNVEVPFVNAIRRIAMVEVPKIAIEDVNIIINDSSMFNEVLAHRLGLVPIFSDNKSIEGLKTPEECDCEDHCPQCSVSLTLQKSGPGVVYTKDLSSTDSKIKPVYDTIPLLKLKENESVELEAVAQLGKGIDHAKWMPTIVCTYKQYPNISFKEGVDVSPDVVEACPRNILQYNKKTKEVTVENVENCSMCKTCVRSSENDAIDVSFIDDTFIFYIETDGSISPEEVLLNACDVLNEKADKFITFFKGG